MRGKSPFKFENMRLKQMGLWKGYNLDGVDILPKASPILC